MPFPKSLFPEYKSVSGQRPAGLYYYHLDSFGSPPRFHVGGVYGMLSYTASGEIELRDDTIGSSSGVGTRLRLASDSEHTIQIVPWSQRPQFMDSNGNILPHWAVTALQRQPPGYRRDRTVPSPGVLIDWRLGVATPLVHGPDGLYAYWPRHDSLPVTWGSWSIALPQEDLIAAVKKQLRTVVNRAKVQYKLLKAAHGDEPRHTDRESRAAERGRVQRAIGHAGSKQFAENIVQAYLHHGEDGMKKVIEDATDSVEATHAVALLAGCKCISYGYINTITPMHSGTPPYGVRSDSTLMQLIISEATEVREEKYLTPVRAEPKY